MCITIGHLSLSKCLPDGARTPFDPQPKVGTKHIDLLKLYKIVVEQGGYDAVSSEKLLWRKLLTERFHINGPHLPAMAFGLKTAFYKNLA